MSEKDFLYYGRYAPLLEQAETFILTNINQIMEDLSEETGQTPAEHIKSRIKSSASMQEKLKKKGFPTDARSALKHVSDAVGIRIVTHFAGDIYTIEERLRKSGAWHIIKEKDYISSPKPNGYRSLHVIIEIPFEDAELSSLRAEIQLRTIAMDCWASLEHQMRYKKGIPNTHLLESELKRCADEMASTDLSMQTIRDMIQQY